MPAHQLRDPIPASAAHICVDMQNLFAEGTDWATPWLKRVLPNVVRLVEPRPDRTVFTRFIPARSPGEGQGTWKNYYERWANMTLSRLPPEAVELVPELVGFTPPASMIDKDTYSPWFTPALGERLVALGADTVIVTGGETDVCVLATVLGAVDRGYRIVVAKDALCSSSDETHDALITLYRERYGQQIELATTDEVLEAWR